MEYSLIKHAWTEEQQEQFTQCVEERCSQFRTFHNQDFSQSGKNERLTQQLLAAYSLLQKLLKM